LDHALADYDQAISLKPNYLAAFYNRGLVFDEKGEYERAVDGFTAVLQAEPGESARPLQAWPSAAEERQCDGRKC
jgi:lipoprotein NlpI